MSLPAQAQIDCRRGIDHKHPICYSHYPGHWQRPPIVHYHHNHHSRDWAGPVIGAAIVGLAINQIARANQPQVIVQPPPVPSHLIVQPPAPVYPQVTCSGWVEIQNPDGTIGRQRNCFQN